MTEAKRKPRELLFWLDGPVSVQKIDAITAAVQGWHAMSYPSSSGEPVKLVFFDHERASAAVAEFAAVDGVLSACTVNVFDPGCEYRVHGAKAGMPATVRCESRRGPFVVFRELNAEGAAVGDSFRKRPQDHTKTNCLRGEWFRLDGGRSVYAADEVVSETLPADDSTPPCQQCGRSPRLDGWVLCKSCYASNRRAAILERATESDRVISEERQFCGPRKGSKKTLLSADHDEQIGLGSRAIRAAEDRS